MGKSESGEGTRAVTYCLIPRELAAKLHEPLRRHFAEDPSVEVVVERRGGSRRGDVERRTSETAAPGAEHRRIHNRTGRRAGERRAAQVPVERPAIELPRKARAHATRLVFVERLVPSDLQVEDLDTARLVTRFQAGSTDVFAELYVRYFDRIYTYLKVLLNEDPHEAEDLTQQVFAKMLAALPRYERRDSPFRAWLFRIARNEGLSQLGRRNRSEVTDPVEIDRRLDEPVEDDVDLTVLNWISDRELLMFVERLPPLQRQVLALRYMLDLTSNETAELLERRPAQVRQLESRALRFLEQRLTAVGRTPREGRRRLQAQRGAKWLPVVRQRRYCLIR